MTESDRKAVGELYAAAWKEGYKGLLPRVFLDEIVPERWSDRNVFLDDGSFVALDGDKIAAHCHARPASEADWRGWGEIHTMYTHPDYWRQGYGTAVFRQAEKWLYEQGFDEVYLFVLEGNSRAECFYKSQGFFPNGGTLCCEIGGAVVTDNRFTKYSSRFTSYGERERITAEGGAASIENVLKNGQFNDRASLLLCLDGYLDPYYGKALPEREAVVKVLEEYEKTAIDSTVFSVRELLEYYQH